MLLAVLVAVFSALAAVAAGIAPAAADDGPSGWLELDAGPAGEVHRLTPGDSADWAVDVRAPGEPASWLAIMLESAQAGSAAEASAGLVGTSGSVIAAAPDLVDFLSVEVSACAEPWVGGSCGQGERTLLPLTAMNRAEGLWVSLMDPGSSWSKGTYVLLSATLAQDAPAEVQGSRMHLVARVHGSGDQGDGDGAGAGLNGAGAGQPGAGLNGGLSDQAGLASTGFRLGAAALLGLLAVGVGFGLARLRGAHA
ncbi:hypothetical protein ACIQC5_08380 [Paenarthrobacter sp. NPDC092416]|uniref:hypothetical protein n=1 Tax=Paenarthrobacter sp. NPDC092416 TaxID=3364386 RepID=UPI0038058842